MNLVYWKTLFKFLFSFSNERSFIRSETCKNIIFVFGIPVVLIIGLTLVGSISFILGYIYTQIMYSDVYNIRYGCLVFGYENNDKLSPKACSIIEDIKSKFCHLGSTDNALSCLESGLRILVIGFITLGLAFMCVVILMPCFKLCKRDITLSVESAHELTNVYIDTINEIKNK